MPDWFAAQVDRMAQPDLPAFDPDAALSDPHPTAGSGRRSAAPPSAGRSADGARVDDSRPTDGKRADSIEDHPLSDVWGDG